ncbi:MAG: DUF975 family protein [Lachnospiraceae bacterium]
MHSFSPQMLLAVIGSIAMIVVVSLVLSLAMTIFLGNPLRVGACRFFMESRGMGRSAGITKVFWAFQCGQFGNIVKTMFLRDLYIILWSLVLVIPGIIKAYEYHMVPYILSENPDMDSREVFQLSKKMMTGQKFAAFVLELSFIGWNLLGALLCVLGMWFVVPYVDATKAELYGILRKEYVPFGLKGYGEMYEQEGESIWQ